jgi:signal transduction histidine kinase
MQNQLEKNARALVALVSNSVLCSIRILDTDKKGLNSVARFFSEHSPNMPEMEETIPVEDTVGGDAVKTGKIQEVLDLATDRRFSNQKILEAGYTSMMAVPLIFKKKAIGVAQIYSKTQKHVFSKKEKQMVIIIANNIATVIVIAEYAKEVERLQRKTFEMEKFCLIGEHAGYVTHAIKNTNVMVGGFAKLIRKIIKSCIEPDIFTEEFTEKIKKIDEYADIIFSENEKLSKKLRHILSVSKSQPKLNAVDVCSLLSKAIETFPGEIKEKKIKLVCHFEANAIVMIDEEQIKEVINELLLNAVDVITQQSSEIAIICRTSLYDGKGHHSILIEVENNGEIPNDTLKQIFDPFFTTKEDGSGFGLFGAKIIVKRHGGEIVVKSENGKTTIKMYIPRKKESVN